MKDFFQGKRIYGQDDDQLLVLDSNKISKRYYLSPYVVVNKGDLFSPSKWINYAETDSVSSFIPLSDLNLDDYEYISDFGPAAARELKKRLSLPLLSNSGLDLQSIFQMKSLPESFENEIREILEFDSYWNEDNLSVFAGDVYISENDFLFLDYEINGITEITSQFEQKEIKEIRKTVKDGSEINLLKIAAADSLYSFQDDDWYLYYPSSEYKDAYVLQLIAIEDLLPFTDFK